MIHLSQERLFPAPGVVVVGEGMLAHSQRTIQATGLQGFACIHSLAIFPILIEFNFTGDASPDRYERRYGRG